MWTCSSRTLMFSILSTVHGPMQKVQCWLWYSYLDEPVIGPADSISIQLWHTACWKTPCFRGPKRIAGSSFYGRPCPGKLARTCTIRNIIAKPEKLQWPSNPSSPIASVFFAMGKFNWRWYSVSTASRHGLRFQVAAPGLSLMSETSGKKGFQIPALTDSRYANRKWTTTPFYQDC
jgi:hypothetical protein